MLVAFDTNMLSLLLHQTDRFPHDPNTKQPISKPKERIEYLLDRLTKNKATIIVPTPALAEFLVVVDVAGPGYLQTISKNGNFEVAEFDEMSAVEAAIIYRELKKKPELEHKDEPKQKVKVDIQIIAIAKTKHVDVLYSTDPNLLARTKAMGLKAVGLWELPEPPLIMKQITFDSALTSTEPGAIEPEPPSSQSLGDGKPKEIALAPPLRVVPPAGPVPPQPDSSPAAPKRPQPKQ